MIGVKNKSSDRLCNNCRETLRSFSLNYECKWCPRSHNGICIKHKIEGEKIIIGAINKELLEEREKFILQHQNK